ncbi:MAG: hypothetical protein JST19_14270 [Bacteroidetes bacterium]|nr:hypothetical protein [Bacteroidota bacterium]
MRTSSNQTAVNILSFLLLSIVAVSPACSGNASRQSNNGLNNGGAITGTKINSDFKEFLKKFQIMSLPLSIKTLEIVADSSKKLSQKDNLFIKSDYPNGIYAYSMLPDTEINYKIIWLEPAEAEIPVLTIFTKDGKKVDQKELGVGGCGSDCGFNCSESITINKGLTIFSCDSIERTTCDTDGNPIKNTTKRYLRFKTGEILRDGKIDMTRIQQRSIN